ncbi:MAG: helix-turn-helix domain-containing protein [Alteromonas sp.]|nr:helix-turn-helix domain-containing protein [Alteromonas sp.]
MLTTKELAESMGVHPETVRRLVKRNKIPYLKISETEFRFIEADVIRALSVNVVEQNKAD